MQNKDREDNAFPFVMLLVILLGLASQWSRNQIPDARKISPIPSTRNPTPTPIFPNS